MDSGHRLLILSINQDLNEFNRICNTISSSLEVNQIQSWLFPSELSADVEDFEIASDVKDTYLSSLEILVDR